MKQAGILAAAPTFLNTGPFYSIFRHGLTLSGYFETDDLPRTQEYLASSETNRRWSERMAPIMKAKIDPSTEFP